MFNSVSAEPTTAGTVFFRHVVICECVPSAAHFPSFRTPKHGPSHLSCCIHIFASDRVLNVSMWARALHLTLTLMSLSIPLLSTFLHVSIHTEDGSLWVDKYAPHSFTQLLSPEKINREVLKALKKWDRYVFKGDGKCDCWLIFLFVFWSLAVICHRLLFQWCVKCKRHDRFHNLRIIRDVLLHSYRFIFLLTCQISYCYYILFYRGGWQCCEHSTGSRGRGPPPQEQGMLLLTYLLITYTSCACPAQYTVDLLCFRTLFLC